MNYTDLKVIGGGIVVTLGMKGTSLFEKRLYCVSDLQHTNDLTPGQLFNAVRELNGKTKEDYGLKWPIFRKPGTSGDEGPISDEKISGQYKYIRGSFNNANSDLEKLVAVCSQLDEEVPELISTEELKKRIEEHLAA